MLLYELFICLLLWSGLIFLFIGTLGFIRLPDLYTRMHATSKCDTLGAGLILVALMFLVGRQDAFKLLLIAISIWSINPLITHVIGFMAYLRDAEYLPETFFMDCYDLPYPGKEMGGKEDVHV